MTITQSTPTVDALTDLARELAGWQSDDAPFQLHPGDLGWFWQHGAAATADAVRTWHDDEQLVAIGLLDGADLLRLTTAPERRDDTDLARRLATDLDDPERGVLPPGEASLEAPVDAPVHEHLRERGWQVGEEWATLSRDLHDPIPAGPLRVETVTPERVDERIAVHRSAFDSTRFTLERWAAVSDGPLHADARSLIGYDEDDRPVAMVTVWSAGPGRPGLLEPMGVHQDHRGRGYGVAISVAGAAVLRQLGASSAQVATPSANTGAVATYVSAGFTPLGGRYDTVRTG